MYAEIYKMDTTVSCMFLYHLSIFRYVHLRWSQNVELCRLCDF